MATAADWPDNLLSVSDLTCHGLAVLLELAAAMKRAPRDWMGAHRSATLACFYDPPTIGVATSIATAAERLGMTPVVLPRRELEGDAIAFVGDGGDSVCHSLMEAGALAGMDVRVACPPQLQPDPLVAFGATVVAERHDARVTVTDDPYEAVAGAAAVYTSAWVPPGRERERDRRRALLHGYEGHPGLMVRAAHRALFLHSLPARRGEEVSSHVIDGDLSVVWEQVANRVPAEEAVVHAMLQRRALRPRGAGL